ncbi:GntR family transcriptional regulator [bacterium]|nr:GntR family transcriptional regulator [bacterium]
MSFAEKPIRSMREQICEAVRAEVISGEMTNDQPLREQSLAKRFGVSRSSVRDALLQLSQEGVLVYKPNKGVRVSSPSSDAEFRLYAKLRKEIEWHCLNICMDQMTEDDDRNLTNLLAALEDSCRRGNLSSITEIDLAMHRYWVSRASKELESVWLSITVRMHITYTLLEDYMQCYQEHAAIVEAIGRRDLKAAKRAVNENIRYK